ncbi:uncharacterized protein F4812DRAFT_432092 [Daldinia caldariorum]|uniref:uncharacterized protein n=1 Tax=Daldinia caldariorum TaxID=326644 RepID=UPI0020081EF5|nr:uncharacterized protein F4812DRAFT_432092 [Daldinia caldariorum]KAI1467302.1 hypothetical protein F4812DRAFT_432092 [Daldinia caldariorum]
MSIRVVGSRDPPHLSLFLSVRLVCVSVLLSSAAERETIIKKELGGASSHIYLRIYIARYTSQTRPGPEPPSPPLSIIRAWIDAYVSRDTSSNLIFILHVSFPLPLPLLILFSSLGLFPFLPFVKK